MLEMVDMVSVIINRMGDKVGNSIPKIAQSGQFNGEKRGEALLDSRSAPRKQLAIALAAIDFVRERGSQLPESVKFWKAVVQGNSIRPWREGIDYVRVGRTDFSTQN